MFIFPIGNCETSSQLPIQILLFYHYLIKTVAVLGAGAVGSYVIWGLSRRKDIRLGVLAEGKRSEKLKKGCTINGEVYHPEVWTPQETKGVDLLIVSLKYGALPGAMDSIRQVTGENTTVMSLMNGVDSEKLISDEIGASHVIYSEFAPHFFPDIFCRAIMQSGISKKSLNGLHTFTVIGYARLSENNANGGFRVKTISIFLFMGSNFYYRIDHMGRNVEQIPAECMQ